MWLLKQMGRPTKKNIMKMEEKNDHRRKNNSSRKKGNFEREI